MEKIGVIYFSATGNTKFVAENIKKELKEKGIDSDLVNIEKDILDVNKYESLIIGGPVHVEKFPKILFKFIDENIPKNYKGRCMIFSTQASNEISSAFQDFLNRTKSLNTTYCAYIPMPNNF